MSRSLILALLLLAVPASGSEARPASPLADAAEKQDRARVQSLLSQGAAANAAQVDGMTALHCAVHYDDAAAARPRADEFWYIVWYERINCDD